jgi:hypothetical protein
MAFKDDFEEAPLRGANATALLLVNVNINTANAKRLMVEGFLGAARIYSTSTSTTMTHFTV